MNEIEFHDFYRPSTDVAVWGDAMKDGAHWSIGKRQYGF